MAEKYFCKYVQAIKIMLAKIYNECDGKPEKYEHSFCIFET